MFDIDGDTAFTHRTLDALEVRTKAAIHNIANQSVAGFKRYTVRFEDRLHDAIEQGRDPGSVEAVVVRDESGAPGENNVVLMDELALLGKASLMHDYMTRRAGAYFTTLNKAIYGR
jgi:flagellar basal body rod protein FlgB